MQTGNIIAHIPARGGSKRVPAKNLRLLAGRPMISYAISAGLNCPELDEVYVNTDSDILSGLAEKMKCPVYRRPQELGTDSASGDDFTYDFIMKKKPDTLVLINPVCPLVKSEDISEAIKAYENSDCDTLISCTETKMQTFCENEPVNIVPEGPLAPSQDNPVIKVCSWAIGIWNCDVFIENYNKFKGGYFGTKRLFWPMEVWRSVKISVESDFILAEKLILASAQQTSKPEYWSPGMPL
ncbi:MAG: acylneuraminate cytidylyltransferase [Denitrovibrio sp.]|nr:MAG: acylneuraminate cytidylyltransferase [Denitrovibrio sp.]